MDEAGDDAQDGRQVWPGEVDDDEVGAVPGGEPSAVGHTQRAVAVSPDTTSAAS